VKKIIYILIIAGIIKIEIFAQACCTAGTPILGALEISSGSKGVLDIGFTYERNVLQDVYERVSRLDDNTRERLTDSFLLELNFGMSERFTATILSTYVNQIRLIRPLYGKESELTGRGIGDVLLLLKYNLITLDIFERRQFSVGVGIKAPIGSSSLKSNGLLLPADMQPGTGSWDGILWAFYSKEISGDFPLTYLINISYRINSANERFGQGSGGYAFGNEFITNIGLAYRTDSLLDFSILIRFRNTVPDKFNKADIPNTGGNWLNLVPGVNIKLFNNFVTRLSGQIPVYRNLMGTQLTTSYTASFSVFYSLKIFE